MTARERLSLIVFSGDYDRVHYALVMASAAAATGRPVTLFLTMGALRLLRAGDDPPGWAALGPAAEGVTALERDGRHARDGIATMEELIAACVEFGVTVQVCEMGMKAEGLSRADLRRDIAVSEGGVVSFLAEAERDGARIVFI